MTTYPFSAIVGHERLRLALLLCAVRPEIGGVLIRGEKGTAKSTAVRGLAKVLAAVDGAALVELPIGATEDRVVGSLDLQKVLRDGEHAFSPGLLARAHGGVLYVDEVNLLHDHLVDVLLDAAAMGRVHVERDGVSHSHDARFVLIGTMNPEEGELRPQLLDRFGLTVDVHASRDVDVRVEVVRQRMAFEADPAGFAARYTDVDAELAGRIAAARAMVSSVCCRTASYAESPHSAPRSTSTVCGPIWSSPGRPSPTRRGAARIRSPKRTSGWPPNWLCRTGGGAIRSTIPGWIPNSSTRRCSRRGSPPIPSRNPSRIPIRRVAVSRRLTDHLTTLYRSRIRARPPGRAHLRRRCSGPGRWLFQVSVRGHRDAGHARATAPERPSRRPPMSPRAMDCTCSGRCWLRPDASECRGGRDRRPTMCASPYGKAAKAIW